MAFSKKTYTKTLYVKLPFEYFYFRRRKAFAICFLLPLFTFCAFKSVAQSNPKLKNRHIIKTIVCSFADEPINVDTVTAHSVPFRSFDYLPALFDRVSAALGLQNYYLENITSNKPWAMAFNNFIGNGDIPQRIIAVDYAYFTDLLAKNDVQSLDVKDAMFLFIIGHELRHHQDYDTFSDTTNNEFKNYSEELSCDEYGGWLIGKMATNINSSNIENFLHLALFSGSDTTIYHPPLKYRILTAEAGWLRGQFDNTRQNVTTTRAHQNLRRRNTESGTILRVVEADTLAIGRITYSNGDWFMGQLNNDGYAGGDGIYLNKNGTIVESIFFGKFSDSKRYGANCMDLTQRQIYNGEYSNNNRNGAGTILIYDSFVNKYEGNFRNGIPNGFGILYYQNGCTFQGEFKDGTINGRGVLYNNQGIVIQDGIWIKNKHIVKH